LGHWLGARPIPFVLELLGEMVEERRGGRGTGLPLGAGGEVFGYPFEGLTDAAALGGGDSDRHGVVAMSLAPASDQRTGLLLRCAGAGEDPDSIIEEGLDRIEIINISAALSGGRFTYRTSGIWPLASGAWGRLWGTLCLSLWGPVFSPFF
jgi:hypothetical protein